MCSSYSSSPSFSPSFPPSTSQFQCRRSPSSACLPIKAKPSPEPPFRDRPEPSAEVSGASATRTSVHLRFFSLTLVFPHGGGGQCRNLDHFLWKETWWLCSAGTVYVCVCQCAAVRAWVFRGWAEGGKRFPETWSSAGSVFLDWDTRVSGKQIQWWYVSNNHATITPEFEAEAFWQHDSSEMSQRRKVWASGGISGGFLSFLTLKGRSEPRPENHSPAGAQRGQRSVQFLMMLLCLLLFIIVSVSQSPNQDLVWDQGKFNNFVLFS